MPSRFSQTWGSEVDVVFEASWTSQVFADALARLRLEVQQCAGAETVRLSWQGARPSPWQLAWIAECVRMLHQAGVCWRWKGSGESGAPAWLMAGGFANDGGFPATG